MSNATKSVLESVVSFDDIHMSSNDDAHLSVSEESKRFLTEISQELSAPLNAIIGFSEILDGKAGQGLAAEKRDEYTGLIHTAARHLEVILKQRLGEIKPYDSELKIQKTQFCMTDLICHVLAILKEFAQSKNIQLITEFSKNISDANADKGMIEQVIMTVISSAIEMSKTDTQICVKLSKFAGKITLSISNQQYQDQASKSENLMSAAACSSAFKKLQMATKIISAHDGSLHVKDAKDGAVKYIIKLPAGYASATQQPFDPANDVINLNKNKNVSAITVDDFPSLIRA